jgi:hypothetical protein
VYHDFLPRLFEYALRHPEVLESCDVLQKIAEHDFSFKPKYNQICHLFELYNPFFFTCYYDDDHYDEDYGHEPTFTKIAISYYEDDDSLELVTRPNLHQTAETHIFFLNIVESCLIYDQKTLLDFLVESGAVSLCGTVINHKADMSSGWRVKVAKKGLWPGYLKMLKHGQENLKTVAKTMKHTTY